MLGKLVDRRGQTRVLIAERCGRRRPALRASHSCRSGRRWRSLVALAAAIGFAVPPLGACVRSLLPSLAPGRRRCAAVYAVEASAVELTWVVGPPLALGLGALLSTGLALVVAGVILRPARGFALKPASRSWRPSRPRSGRAAGALRAPAMQTLVIVFVAVGVLFGARRGRSGLGRVGPREQHGSRPAARALGSRLARRRRA